MPIPDYTLDALKAYVEHGIPPGDFVRAVLENRFVEVVCRADDNNTVALREIAWWVYNEAPTACWGNREKVDVWIEAKQLVREGIKEKSCST